MAVLSGRQTPGDLWRTFRVAAWLGWQVESNWAEPVVFFIFAILRPISTALILLLMYVVIAGEKRDPFFDYLYISNALFIIVMQSIANMSWTIFDDREHYKMLKYVYTSPASKYAYLLGRALARVIIGITTCIILLVAGRLFMGLHLDIYATDWGWLATYFAVGMIILLSFGLMLAGIALLMARHGEFMGEVTAGMLLLFCSVYFPPDILPAGIRQVSLALPMTYWLEAMRRALVGGILQSSPGQPISPMLARFSNPELALVLTISAVLSLVVSYLFYNWIEQRAKEKGMLDRTSGY
jgi:ABC-2 type transport system permease protein